MGESIPQGTERRLGLDLLRLLSMVMVIVLHILGQGGVLEGAEPGSRPWYAAWGLECLCYCAVDCYGLLTGYLGGGRRPYAKLVLLWLETVLYSLFFWLFFHWYRPEQAGTPALLRVFLPVLTRQYWYFSAYFGLALLMPLLEGGLKAVDSRRATALFFVLTAVFCALPTVLHTDAFQLRGGYAMLWLLILYVLGALLRRSEPLHRPGPLPLCLAAAACFILTFRTHFHPVTIPGLSTFDLLSYTSPTVLLFAVCLLMLFRRLKAGGRPGAGLLTKLSRTSFGVYILHTNPLLWKTLFLPGCLASWGAMPAKLLLPLVPLCALGVYLLCSVPTALVHLLFRALGLRTRLESLGDRLRRRPDARKPAQ